MGVALKVKVAMGFASLPAWTWKSPGFQRREEGRGGGEGREENQRGRIRKTKRTGDEIQNWLEHLYEYYSRVTILNCKVFSIHGQTSLLVKSVTGF